MPFCSGSPTNTQDAVMSAVHLKHNTFLFKVNNFIQGPFGVGKQVNPCLCSSQESGTCWIYGPWFFVFCSYILLIFIMPTYLYIHLTGHLQYVTSCLLHFLNADMCRPIAQAQFPLRGNILSSFKSNCTGMPLISPHLATNWNSSKESELLKNLLSFENYS